MMVDFNCEGIENDMEVGLENSYPESESETDGSVKSASKTKSRKGRASEVGLTKSCSEEIEPGTCQAGRRPKGTKGSVGPGGARRNQRERNRVRQVNLGFDRLRDHVPAGRKNRKLSKLDTIRAAVIYINELKSYLDQLNNMTHNKTDVICNDVIDDAFARNFDSVSFHEQIRFIQSSLFPQMTSGFDDVSSDDKSSSNLCVNNNYLVQPHFSDVVSTSAAIDDVISSMNDEIPPRISDVVSHKATVGDALLTVERNQFGDFTNQNESFSDVFLTNSDKNQPQFSDVINQNAAFNDVLFPTNNDAIQPQFSDVTNHNATLNDVYLTVTDTASQTQQSLYESFLLGMTNIQNGDPYGRPPLEGVPQTDNNLNSFVVTPEMVDKFRLLAGENQQFVHITGFEYYPECITSSTGNDIQQSSMLSWCN